jgi:hypothetical protein
VLQIDANRLVRRISLAKKYMYDDQRVREVYGHRLNTIFAYLDLYVALHFMISRHKRLGMRFLLLSLKNYPAVACRYRFWVVIKKLILFW